MAGDIRIVIVVAAMLVEFWHRTAHGSWLAWPVVAAAVLLAWFTAVPRTMGPIARLLMRVAAVIGRVNNVVVLGVLFFVIITPLGGMMRRMQRRRLGLDRLPSDRSYWTPRADRGRNVDFTKMY